MYESYSMIDSRRYQTSTPVVPQCATPKLPKKVLHIEDIEHIMLCFEFSYLTQKILADTDIDLSQSNMSTQLSYNL